MKVLLIDIDSRPPYGSLALKKIARYHNDQGHQVTWNMPIMKNCVGKIYVSCIFSWNQHRHLAAQWLNRNLNVTIEEYTGIYNMKHAQSAVTIKKGENR